MKCQLPKSRDFTSLFSYIRKKRLFTVFQGHLHGKTGQFTVWANGKQNSRPVNFIPGSRLPCAQTSSVRPRRPETGIKDRLRNRTWICVSTRNPAGALTICTEISVKICRQMILTLAVYHFSKNFRKVPLESKCNTLFGKFLEETGHLKR